MSSHETRLPLDEICKVPWQVDSIGAMSMKAAVVPMMVTMLLMMMVMMIALREPRHPHGSAIACSRSQIFGRRRPRGAV